MSLLSDLQNWECLTGSKGNQEDLKEKIVEFYYTNFAEKIFDNH